MSTFNQPTPIPEASLSKSSHINDLSEAIKQAFELLPNEDKIKLETINYYTATGIANNYSITIPGITSYTDGMKIVLKSQATNTGLSTLNINSIGAIEIKSLDSQTLSSNVIIAGIPTELRYSSTTGYFHLYVQASAPISGALLVVNALSELAGLSSTVRANLGLAIGTQIQAFNDKLLAIANVAGSADKLLYFTGLSSVDVTSLSTFIRTLLDDTDSLTARNTLGIGSIGTKNSLSAVDIPSLDWTKITTGKPTTLLGYGITISSGDIPSLDWSKITTGKPTTLAGYGIDDAAGASHLTDYALHLTSAQNTWIDAISATAAEINQLVGVTPGSITTSKAVIRNSSGHIMTNYLNMTSNNIGVTSTFSSIPVESSSDGFLRWNNPTDFETNCSRNKFTRETNGGTLLVGKIYSIYTGGGAITMSMPAITNSASGDVIEIMNLLRSWGNNIFTLTCPANVYIHNLANGESLICDTNDFSGLTLRCNYNDGTSSYWSIN